MKRLKELCSFLSCMFSGMAGSFLALALARLDVKYLIFSIAMAFLCGIIVYNSEKAEEEEDGINKKEN